ncbi:hypothetical protein CLOSTMETH_01661 [[Clostridium] methylpentosum DSM 5476]|uniref:Uncharacterized protein n=1 Tax=[Clostridium] methylpentosum DSM 5476 TaxID=537013 RepID=C0ECU0_9FIRM|nr:hypothetical protein CLOSTMETH_01661 [[Clostridium] methylpentosum DSM 5476]
MCRTCHLRQDHRSAVRTGLEKTHKNRAEYDTALILSVVFNPWYCRGRQ